MHAWFMLELMASGVCPAKTPDNNAMNRSGFASAAGWSRLQFAQGFLLEIAPTFGRQRPIVRSVILVVMPPNLTIPVNCGRLP